MGQPREHLEAMTGRKVALRTGLDHLDSTAALMDGKLVDMPLHAARQRRHRNV